MNWGDVFALDDDDRRRLLLQLVDPMEPPPSVQQLERLPKQRQTTSSICKDVNDHNDKRSNDQIL